MVESELSGAVCEWLSGRGLKVYAEVFLQGRSTIHSTRHRHYALTPRVCRCRLGGATIRTVFLSRAAGVAAVRLGPPPYPLSGDRLANAGVE